MATHTKYPDTGPRPCHAPAEREYGMDDGTADRSEPTTSAIILAGGQSRRLGRDKCLLDIGGRSLLRRTVDKLVTVSDDLIVVTSDLTYHELLDSAARLVPDQKPGMGSLMGIYSGLKEARHAHALVVACDMPFLSLALIRHMLPLADAYDVVIPCLDGMLEPLHAIYGKSCLPYMLQHLDQGQRRIISFFDRVSVRYVEKQEVDRFDPSHLSFVNVNTPQDWIRVQELLAQQESS
jgi:molybdopterin-guanine dinucleotide biosynthesis protein A